MISVASKLSNDDIGSQDTAGEAQTCIYLIKREVVVPLGRCDCQLLEPRLGILLGMEPFYSNGVRHEMVYVNQQPTTT